MTYRHINKDRGCNDREQLELDQTESFWDFLRSVKEEPPLNPVRLLPTWADSLSACWATIKGWKQEVLLSQIKHLTLLQTMWDALYQTNPFLSGNPKTVIVCVCLVRVIVRMKTAGESALFRFKTFFPLDSLDYWVNVRHDISVTRRTGASLLYNYRRIIASLYSSLCDFSHLSQKKKKKIDDLKSWLHSLTAAGLSSPVIPFYNTSNTNTVLQTKSAVWTFTVCTQQVNQKKLEPYLLLQWSCPQWAENNCNNSTTAHLQWATDLMIALFNRFMTRIQWHMAGRLHYHKVWEW